MKRYIMMGTGLFIAETLIVLVSLGQRPTPSPTATPGEPGKPTDTSKFDEPMPLQPVDRFDGRASVSNARLLAAGQAEIQMTLRNWTIPNRQRIERFPETDAGPEALYWSGVAQYSSSHDASVLKALGKKFKERYTETSWAKRASVW